jgi:hypothetical protein
MGAVRPSLAAAVPEPIQSESWPAYSPTPQSGDKMLINLGHNRKAELG